MIDIDMKSGLHFKIYKYKVGFIRNIKSMLIPIKQSTLVKYRSCTLAKCWDTMSFCKCAKVIVTQTIKPCWLNVWYKCLYNVNINSWFVKCSAKFYHVFIRKSYFIRWSNGRVTALCAGGRGINFRRSNTKD